MWKVGQLFSNSKTHVYELVLAVSALSNMTGGGSKLFFSALFFNFFAKVDMPASTGTHQAPGTPKLPFWPDSAPYCTDSAYF